MHSVASRVARRLNTNFAPAGSALVKRRRFYKTVDVIDDAQAGRPAFKIVLDGRVLKTQAGKSLVIESEPLALAIATEWSSQDEFLEIGSMRLTGLAFTASDNPLQCTKESMTQKVLEYLDGDTILFQNDESSKLHAEQERVWTPLINNVNRELGTSFKPSTNMFAEIVSSEDRSTFSRWLLGQNAWALHGIQYATESVKSALIPFNVLLWKITAPEAVEAAMLERKVQSQFWGEVEWAHDVEDEELLSRLSGACLFTYLASNHAYTTSTAASL